MMKDNMIENKLILHASHNIIVCVDETGKVWQGIVLYFIDDVPIWKS